jgi:hypothetical protein
MPVSDREVPSTEHVLALQQVHFQDPPPTTGITVSFAASMKIGKVVGTRVGATVGAGVRVHTPKLFSGML